MCFCTLSADLPLALPVVAKSLHPRGFCYLTSYPCQLSHFLCVTSLSSYLRLLHEGKAWYTSLPCVSLGPVASLKYMFVE